jgi:uncharacterized membrane protein YsdA (DUF1294 family)
VIALIISRFIPNFSETVWKSFSYLKIENGFAQFVFAVVIAIASISPEILSNFAVDKKNASENKFRISERNFHLLEIRGGWLASYFAQRKFRHKLNKNSYQRTFWLILLFHTTFFLKIIFFYKTDQLFVIPAIFLGFIFYSMVLGSSENRKSHQTSRHYDEEISWSQYDEEFS